MKSFSETWFGKKLVWGWKRIVAFFAICVLFVKKFVTLVEDMVTDINGKGEIRVILGIFCSFVVFKLALDAPSFILACKPIDLIAYATLETVLTGFALSLFGIAKSSLEASSDKTDPATSLIDQMREKVAKIIAPSDSAEDK